MWSHPEGAYKDGDGTNNYNTAEDERRSLNILSKELCQNTRPVGGGAGGGGQGTRRLFSGGDIQARLWSEEDTQ